MAQRVYLKKSSVADKTPSADSVNFGELAINYASGVGKSFLATKKQNGTMAKFHEDAYNEAKFADKSEVMNIQSNLSNYALSGTVKNQISGLTVIIEDDEYVIAQTFNNQNDRITALEEATQGLSGEYLTLSSASTVFSNIANDVNTANALAHSAYNYTDAISATVNSNYYTKTDTDTQIANASSRTVTEVEDYVTDRFVPNSTYDTFTSTTSSDISFIKSNYALSATVKSAITVINDTIEENEYVVSAALNDFNNRLNRLSGFTGDYLTIDSADTVFTTISNNVNQASTLAQSAYTYADTVNGKLSSYATNDSVNSASANAIAIATNSALTYVGSNYVDKTTYDNFTGDVSSNLSILKQSASTISGNVIALSAAVSTKLASVYRYKGTKATASQLPTAGNEEGDVWNVSAASGDTPAGTNYAWVKDGNSGYWDALGGSIDLSGFFTTENAETMRSQLENADNMLGNKIDAVSGTVKNTYWTSATTRDAITASVITSINSAYTKSSGYTKNMIDAVSGTVDTYKASNDSFHDSIKTGLSSWTVTNAATHSEVKSASGNALSQANTYTNEQITSLSATVKNNYLSVTSANSIVTTLSNSIDGVGNALTGFSASVVSDYATDAQASSYAAAALSNSMDYTDSKISGIGIGNYLTVESAQSIVTTLSNGIDGANTLAQSAYTRAEQVNSSLSNYATKELLGIISGNAVSVAELYADNKFLTKASAGTMYDTLSSNIVDARTLAQSAYTHADQISATMQDDYASKTLVANVSANTLNAAKNYANEKFLTTESATSIVSTFNSSFDSIKNGLSAWTVNNAATHSEVKSASGNALSQATAYTDDQISSLSATVKNNYLSVASANSIVTTLSNSINGVETKLNTLSGSVISTYATKTVASGYAVSALSDANAYTDSKISGIGIGNYLTVSSAQSIVTTLSNDISGARILAQSAYTRAEQVNSSLSNYATKELLGTISSNTLTAANNYANGKFLTVASASNIVTTLNNNINGANTLAQSAYTRAEQVNSSLSNYATKELLGIISSNTLTSANNYADGKFLTTTSADTIVTTLNNSINGVDTKVVTLSASVVNNYVTDAKASSYAAAALSNSMDYTDSKIVDLAIGDYLTVASANSVVTSLNSSINGVNNTVTAFSASVINKIGTVFKYKGSVQNYSNLPTNAETGDTYNVVNANGNTPAGTNYTWNGTAWDPLAGTVDLTPYLTRESAATIFTSVHNDINQAQTLAQSAYTYANTINSDYASKALLATISANTLAAATGASQTYVDNNFFTKESAGTMYDSISSMLSDFALSGTVNEEITNINNTITDNEEVTSAALNDLNTRYNNMNQLVSTFTTRFYPTTAATEAFTQISNSLDQAQTLAQSAYTYADSINTDISDCATHDEVGSASANSVAIAAQSAITQADDRYATTGTVAGVQSDISILKQSAATLDSKFVKKAGDTMTGHLNFDTASAAYSSNGLRWGTNKAGIGASSNGGLGLYANEQIYLRPNNQFASSTNGLVVGNTAFTYNTNNVYHEGNLSPVTLNTVQTIASAKTFSQKITANVGITLQSAATFTNSYRAVPFSDTVHPLTNIRYINTNVNSGLTYNPFTGKLRAYGFVINGKAATDLLNAAGGTTSSAGFVPTGRTVNGHMLSGNVTVSKADVGLGSVENTALSTWTGNTSIKSVGTITAGTWNGTKIANAYLVNNAVAIDGKVVALGTSATTINVSQSLSSTANYRPILIGYTSNASAAALSASTTGVSYVAKNLYVKPSTAEIHAGGYVIDGKAATDLLNATGGVTTVASIRSGYVPTTRKVNGHALSADVTVTKTDLSLGNVENTALSTWTGNTSIASVGTITAGTWNGTPIATTYLAKSAITINGSSVGLGGSVTLSTTDKNVGQASSTAAERRALILGTTTAATGTALTTTAVTGETAFNKDIYAIPSTGQLNSKQVRIDEKVTLQYNTTTEALDFVFS